MENNAILTNGKSLALSVKSSKDIKLHNCKSVKSPVPKISQIYVTQSIETKWNQLGLFPNGRIQNNNRYLVTLQCYQTKRNQTTICRIQCF